MQPHSMPPGCNLFDVDLARVVGVGAALHRQPPRLQASSGAFQPGGLQPGALLCTREDMDAICTYDIHQASWRQVREKLAELAEVDYDIDWRDGQEFPWGVWLANTGQIRDLSNDGIYSVRLEVRSGLRRVVVHSVGGRYYISHRIPDGKMLVVPAPRLYRG